MAGSNKESIGKIKNCKAKSLHICNLFNHGHGVLAGNKMDLDQRKCVSEVMAVQMATTNNMHHIPCSAKDMQNIVEIFNHLATEYFNKNINNSNHKSHQNKKNQNYNNHTDDDGDDY
ncbi:hypothetical protein HELRODRAFT_182389 [Helobdella robusta]|uniref:Uncharacterized protein n=1 Tax=Helobdella robusta TaxID=6412 RepID=T1FI45_HELRO|nr:hypothetical protein HELRODRAFT_182389 [Helobdella robusta]ESN91040.1 hypothetical protein HELRODRAFT_182389 [Helobdella robusta]